MNITYLAGTQQHLAISDGRSVPARSIYMIYWHFESRNLIVVLFKSL
jgi:hypothetical protein